MSYHDTLVTEINRRLDELAANGQPWVAKWIAHAICEKHGAGLVSNEHALFWKYCGYELCRDRVRRVINRRAGTEADEERDGKQGILPGYEHVHLYYLVERDGEEVAVFVGHMTDPELIDRAAQYRQIGRGCFAHASELDRFRDARKATKKEAG